MLHEGCCLLVVERTMKGQRHEDSCMHGPNTCDSNSIDLIKHDSKERTRVS